MTYSGGMNIVVSNVKGGVGKTTTCVYLAASAVEQGYASVMLVDADRQASAAEWFEDNPVDGVDLVEAPSERTVTRAMADSDSVVVIDTPPGDERIVKAALARADSVVIPTRAGGVEPTRVAATLELVPDGVPYGIVVCAARLGTNDLTETVEGWDAGEGTRVGGHPRAGGHRRRSGRPALPGGPRRIHGRVEKGDQAPVAMTGGIAEKIAGTAAYRSAEQFRGTSGRERRPHNLPLYLDDHQREWLREAAWESRTSASALLRAMIRACETDPAVREAIEANLER